MILQSIPLYAITCRGGNRWKASHLTDWRSTEANPGRSTTAERGNYASIREGSYIVGDYGIATGRGTSGICPEAQADAYTAAASTDGATTSADGAASATTGRNR